MSPEECRWRFPQDVSVNAFETWRGRNVGKSVKPLNEDLNCKRAFLNRMVQCGRIAANPLRMVQKHSTRGHERRKRRAYSGADLVQLATVARLRLLPYLLLLAAHASLRRLRQTSSGGWVDVQLEAVEPFLVVRAKNAKNRRKQDFLLRRDAVGLLPPIQASPVASPLASPETGPACLVVSFADTEGTPSKREKTL
jgi:hypothetical protein